MYIHFELILSILWAASSPKYPFEPRLCEKTGWRDYNYENRCRRFGALFSRQRHPLKRYELVFNT
jgi:hypothetical protein